MGSRVLAQLKETYRQPFFDLVRQAQEIHRRHWPHGEVQLCSLLSIKTGGCSEDCAYCSQSARYSTGVKVGPLMRLEEIVHAAQQARVNGASRFCMGAAWKGVREQSPQFAAVLAAVRAVRQLGLEVCVTLGQLSDEGARQLRAAGLTAYNHNLDTGPEFYPQIVSTHTFGDRLATIRAVQRAGISLCCGGIIGLGESETDRLRMLEVLLDFDPLPESVPINCLIPMPGTPLAEQTPVDVFELVRLIATVRIALPGSKIRLSAGRTTLTREGQAWCFYTGANSIFLGSKLLTAPNPDADSDHRLLAELGLVPQRFPEPVPAQ